MCCHLKPLGYLGNFGHLLIRPDYLSWTVLLHRRKEREGVLTPFFSVFSSFLLICFFFFFKPKYRLRIDVVAFPSLCFASPCPPLPPSKRAISKESRRSPFLKSVSSLFLLLFPFFPPSISVLDHKSFFVGEKEKMKGERKAFISFWWGQEIPSNFFSSALKASFRKKNLLHAIFFKMHFYVHLHDRLPTDLSLQKKPFLYDKVPPLASFSWQLLWELS